MTVEAPERKGLGTVDDVAPTKLGDEEFGPPPSERKTEDQEPLVGTLATSVAAFLSSAAAGWMCAGLFRGTMPKLVALLGPLIGAGLVAYSFRTRRPSAIQYLALPVAIVAGTVLVIPDATGGTANLPGLISEAIRTGGVSQPPVAFDPGWRFILLVLTAVLATAGASSAIGLNRPKLAVFLPVPVVFAVALLLPSEGTVVTSGVGLALLVGSLAVSYGAELAREGATSSRFELRRLGRGAGIVAVLVIALIGLSQAGFLFPDVERDQEIPPTRPERHPPQKDRVLFTVSSGRPGPWRLGVLDVYDGRGWLLPSFNTKRLIDVASAGTLGPAGPRPSGRKTFDATFRIVDVEGHVIPTVAGAQSIQRSGSFAVTFDPRTQMLRLPDARARAEMRYTIVAAEPPTAKDLSAAPAAPAEIRRDFVAQGLPAPPPQVAAVLADAPASPAFERLQFVRNAFYREVVAAGAGDPIDVPPTRVAEMLAGPDGIIGDGKGGEGTPYEITAAEVLLARWAGIPARIGYGFYGGDKKGTDWSVRPRHGSTWLEAYFHGSGWIPIIGTPPRAKASLSQDQKQDQPNIKPTEELALVIYIPVKLQSIRLLFVVVRYWIAVTLPIAAGVALAWGFYPAALKGLRRLRRRRWAANRGLTERIAVAYAELRDTANDLNVGDPSVTPLRFLGAIEPDQEHDELAWLVTRALWGDLRRDLRAEDAEAAEDMARSIARRLRRAQPALTRALGLATRASLREPYSDEIPNLWPKRTLGDFRAGIRRTIRRPLRLLLRPLRLIRRLIPIGTLLALALVAAACGQGAVSPTAALVRPVLPETFVPDAIGTLKFQREPDAEKAYKITRIDSLVAEGRVFTAREEGRVKGALQVGAFKPGLRATQREIREGVLESIGSGGFELTRIGTERIFVQEQAEQKIFLWFPARMEYYEIFVAAQGFEEADRIFAAILAFQKGEDVTAALRGSGTNLRDPRRGAPE